MFRMSSYMSRGQKLIEAGKTPDAMRLVTRGFQHYAERVLKAIQPYAKADACMLVLILRHIADEIERNNPGTKEQVEVLKKAVVLPTIEEIEKVKRPRPEWFIWYQEPIPHMICKKHCRTRIWDIGKMMSGTGTVRNLESWIIRSYIRCIRSLDIRTSGKIKKPWHNAKALAISLINLL